MYSPHDNMAIAKQAIETIAYVSIFSKNCFYFFLLVFFMVGNIRIFF